MCVTIQLKCQAYSRRSEKWNLQKKHAWTMWGVNIEWCIGWLSAVCTVHTHITHIVYRIVLHPRRSNSAHGTRTSIYARKAQVCACPCVALYESKSLDSAWFIGTSAHSMWTWASMSTSNTFVWMCRVGLGAHQHRTSIQCVICWVYTYYKIWALEGTVALSFAFITHSRSRDWVHPFIVDSIFCVFSFMVCLRAFVLCLNRSNLCQSTVYLIAKRISHRFRTSPHFSSLLSHLHRTGADSCFFISFFRWFSCNKICDRISSKGLSSSVAQTLD